MSYRIVNPEFIAQRSKRPTDKDPMSCPSVCSYLEIVDQWYRQTIIGKPNHIFCVLLVTKTRTHQKKEIDHVKETGEHNPTRKCRTQQSSFLLHQDTKAKNTKSNKQASSSTVRHPRQRFEKLELIDSHREKWH